MVRPSLRSLLLALALAVVSYIVTHLLPIPGGLRQVMTATGGPLLDQIPSMSGADVYARIAAFGAQGRELYRADVIENVFVWIMLTDFPAPHPFLGGAIVYPTAAKWLALISALLVPTAMIIAWRWKSLFVGSDGG